MINKPIHIFLALIMLPGLVVSCRKSGEAEQPLKEMKPAKQNDPIKLVIRPKNDKERFLFKLADAAFGIIDPNVIYDSSYVQIKYPGGDVPSDKGVCCDVVIRSYRKMGIDLQEKVHEDMRENFSAYPKNWGLSAPDSNIDHRRVPNLMKFFERKGESLPVTGNPKAYLPGDIVTWDVESVLTKMGITGNRPHIGIVSNRLSDFGKRPMIVHNIGSGQVLEDMLFDFKIIGHYRYYPPARL